MVGSRVEIVKSEIKFLLCPLLPHSLFLSLPPPCVVCFVSQRMSLSLFLGPCLLRWVCVCFVRGLVWCVSCRVSSSSVDALSLLMVDFIGQPHEMENVAAIHQVPGQKSHVDDKGARLDPICTSMYCETSWVFDPRGLKSSCHPHHDVFIVFFRVLMEVRL